MHNGHPNQRPLTITHRRERSTRVITRMPGLSGHRQSVSIMFVRRLGAVATVASMVATHQQAARAHAKGSLTARGTLYDRSVSLSSTRTSLSATGCRRNEARTYFGEQQGQSSPDARQTTVIAELRDCVATTSDVTAVSDACLGKLRITSLLCSDRHEAR